MEAVSTDHDMALGKRKAEGQGVEDSDDSVSSGEGEKGGSSSAEHSGFPILADSKEWEWGYDSFEGLEYVPAPEGYFSDEESQKKYSAYRKQEYEHRGFYIDADNIPRGQIGIVPCKDIDKWCPVLRKTEREHMADVAKLAVQKYNEINGTNVRFESVERMTRYWSLKVRSYVTILVKENPDKPDEPLVEYQVKVQRRIMGKDVPIFCRPAVFKPIGGGEDRDERK